jgi:hypothetical protein
MKVTAFILLTRGKSLVSFVLKKEGNVIISVKQKNRNK